MGCILMKNNKISYKFAKVILSQTFLNFIPTFISVILWLGIFGIGSSYIKSEYLGSQGYALVMVVWLIVCLSLSKIIVTHPILVYSEKKEGEKRA